MIVRLTGATRLRLDATTEAKDSYVVQVEDITDTGQPIWRDARADDVDAQGNLLVAPPQRKRIKEKKRRGFVQLHTTHSP